LRAWLGVTESQGYSKNALKVSQWTKVQAGDDADWKAVFP